MRLGIDGRKIPQAAERGPIGSLEHGKELGMAGLFYRYVLDMSPTLDKGELGAIKQRADELGMYIETGLGKTNPYANPEAPELRAIGDGDILLGFRRMMEACASIGIFEVWSATANYKGAFRGRFAYDRFRTDVTWLEQLKATENFLKKLAPICRDLGMHINLETHEEITSFELVRLVEAVGPDAIGITFDTGNVIQRAEHPIYAAKRVAPYVRQTHIKDAFVAFEPGGGLDWQMRPCGQGVVDFRQLLSIVAAANPKLNLSIENAEPRTSPPNRMAIGIFDPLWLEGHPDLSIEEFAALLELINAYGKRIASGEIETWESYSARPFGVPEALAEIQVSAGHLRSVCTELNLPLEAA